jgi:hypothetical protein
MLMRQEVEMRALTTHHLYRFAAIGLLLLSVCASGSALQSKVSLIRVEVKPEGTGPIKSLVEDGQYLRIEEKTGRTLAFKPDVHTRPAKIRVFEILKSPDGTEKGEQPLDEAEVEIGASSPKLVAKTYLVRILEVVPAK